MIGKEETVLKTFTDYSGEIHTELLEIKLPKESSMAGKAIMDLDIPMDILIVMIKRNGKILTPRGATVLEGEDTIMLAADNKAQLIELGERVQQKR